MVTLPEPKKPKALPKPIPIEIVREKPKKKPLETKQAKKPVQPKPKPAKPTTTRKAEPKAKKSEKPKKPKQPKEPKEAAKQKEPAKAKEAAKPKHPNPPVPPRKPVPPKRAETAPPRQEPRLLPTEKPRPPVSPTPKKKPQLALGPKPPLLRPKPPAPPKPRLGRSGLAVPPIGVPPPNAKRRKLAGRWLLVPLVVDVGHRCGKARVTGVMRIANGKGSNFLAEIRTTIRWTLCPPGRSLYRGVLAIRGKRVILFNGTGISDRGFMQGNVMILRDKLGNSVWRKLKTPVSR